MPFVVQQTPESRDNLDAYICLFGFSGADCEMAPAEIVMIQILIIDIAQENKRMAGTTIRSKP